MATSYVLNRSRTGTSQAFWAILLIIGFVACRKEQENQPTPQASRVLISGKDYSTLTIGNHIWTITNYDGPGGIPYKTGQEKPEYGRYYTVEEAKAIALPAGWRLPTRQDYIALAQSQGVVFSNNRATSQEVIKKLAATTNWRTVRGTNTSGFNAQPAGYSFRNSEPLDGDIAEFWAADGSTFSIQESAAGNAHTILLYGSDDPAYRFNLRFVKDR